MRKASKLIITVLIIVNAFPIFAYASENTFSNFEDVQQYIYNSLKERDNKIQFTYIGPQDNYKENIGQVINKALSEDDYTGRAWKSVKSTAETLENEINTDINVSYLTTKEQEDYVDIEINEIMVELIKPYMSEIEKVEAINNYLVNRYEYDDTHESNDAYSALSTGETTCQGYAMTAYKMLSSAGIENRIIVGELKGVPHGWNLVKIYGKWYHLDITNNDSTSSYKYFLVNASVLEDKGFSWDKTAYPETNN